MAKHKNSRKRLTWTSSILVNLLAVGSFVEDIYSLRQKILYKHKFGEYPNSNRNFRRAFIVLARKGWVKYEDTENKKFIKLTEQGELEALVLFLKQYKRRVNENNKDGTLLVFDIPEGSNALRHYFRRLITSIGFEKIQQSVYFAKFNLPPEAYQYLKKSELEKFVKIFRVI